MHPSLPLDEVPCGDVTLIQKDNSRSDIETCEAELVKIRTSEDAQSIDTVQMDVEIISKETFNRRAPGDGENVSFNCDCISCVGDTERNLQL